VGLPDDKQFPGLDSRIQGKKAHIFLQKHTHDQTPKAEKKEKRKYKI
jgi:hypothetical protein